MLYLIASDIHGSKGASELLVSLETKYNFKKIILLGDIGYSGARNIPPFDYYPISVYENLSKLKHKLIVIKGNCDSRVDEFVLGIKFRNKLKICIKSHVFYLTHGDLYSENDFSYKDLDCFIYGHTHVYKLEKSNNHFVINPGSLSLPKINKEKTYIIYDDEREVFSLFDINENLLNEMKIC